MTKSRGFQTAKQNCNRVLFPVYIFSGYIYINIKIKMTSPMMYSCIFPKYASLYLNKARYGRFAMRMVFYTVGLNYNGSTLYIALVFRLTHWNVS